MTTDIESNKKPQEQLRSSQDIQGESDIVQIDSHIAHSKKAKRDKKNEIKIESVDSVQAPELPIKRPKKNVEKKLRKGEAKIHKYIAERKSYTVFFLRGLNSCFNCEKITS